MRSIGIVGAAGLAASVALGGCSMVEPRVDPRGQRIEAYQLEEIVPGVQTRADVAALLGTPSTTAPFGDDDWYYVSSVTRSRVGRMQAVDSQTVVAIRFDERGVVQRVETIGLEDAQQVTPVARVTPTPGTEKNFFQMLFGNIGRFSPGDSGSRLPGNRGL